MSTSDRQFREYLDDPSMAARFLDVLTGLRVKEINLDEQGERKLRYRIKQLEESLVRRGAMAEYKRAYDPKQAGILQ